MFRFIVHRLGMAIPTLLLISVMVFALIRFIPGDPALLMLGDMADPQSLAQMRSSLGLDHSVVTQYLIRETTHRFSRLSFHRSMVGRRLPLLMTATGRAYFAFCPPAEREELIELLISRDDAQSALAADRRFVERLIEHTRSKGYGENNAHWGEERKIAAIAIPVMHEARVMGCLNLVYIAKAMPVEEAARRFLPAMHEVVGNIQTGLIGG